MSFKYIEDKKGDSHIYPTKMKRISKTYHFFLKAAGVTTISFQHVFKKTVFKPDGGLFVKAKKNCVFVMLCLRIKLCNENRLVKESFFEIPISSLILPYGS